MDTDRMGQKATDKLTGFTGKVTGQARYITGCDQFLVQPPCKEDGTYVDGRWFDENRLGFVEEPDEEKVEIDTSQDIGACDEAPIK